MKRLLSIKMTQSKLSVKIWINLVMPTLAILLVLIFAVSIYFNGYVLKNSVQRAAEETDYVAAALNSTYEDLLSYFVRTTTSVTFIDNLKKIASAVPTDYADINNSLQGIFSDYPQVNKLLDSCLLASGPASMTPSMLFHSYKFRIGNSNLSYDLNYSLDDVSGITIIPGTTSPFTTQSQVIPIVIPLRYTSSNSFISIADNVKDAHAILYLFVSIESLSDFLKLYCNDASEGLLYLVDRDGDYFHPATLNEASAVELSPILKDVIAEDKTGMQYHDDYIFIGYSQAMDRYVVNHVSEAHFRTDSNNLMLALRGIMAVSILLVTYLSMMINRHVAKPLTQLMQSLHEIEDQTYQGKADITADDEIGRLGEAIDSMFNTIQQQILTIKQEEKEKYDTKLQLLSEQINPHFLYNALEFINMEVYNRHNENASGMISSLGEYLRIGLAYGDNEVLLSQELEQVMAYVRIMNYRFHNSIQVTTDIPEQLLSARVVKCILQPLVENSLKHGFQIGSSSGFPFSPMISITMHKEGNKIVLSVTDNGAGIDIAKATRIMHTKQADDAMDRHLGLNNIYERLNAYYKDVAIEFASIPYFENRVIITLPANCFDNV